MIGDIVNILAGSLLPQKRKMIGGTVVAIIVAVLGVTAYVGAVFSAFFALAPIYGSAAACLLVAAASVVLIPVVLAIYWIAMRLSERRRYEKARSQATSQEAQLAELAATALPLMLHKNPVATVGLVAGLSFLITRMKT